MNKSNLDFIFNFLKKNRKFPDLQRRNSYRQILNPLLTKEEQVRLFFDREVKTQQNLKMTQIVPFWEHVESHKHLLSTFKGVMRMLGAPQNDRPYEEMFNHLKKQPLWGPKTSALFVKAVYQIHHGKLELDPLWPDTPSLSSLNDKFYLPVDVIIINIFRDFLGMKKPTFKSINQVIHQHYRGSDVVIWDDLWFWGFITQFGSEDRTYAWNKGKYFSLVNNPQSPSKLLVIEEKAKEFLSVLKHAKKK